MVNRWLLTSSVPTLIPRIIVGLVFLSEGIQKFTFADSVGAGRFAKIGFENAEFWAGFTGCFEIVCGLLVLFGLFTRLAALPLLVVMIVAFITTKYPTLVKQGFFPMAHEYRTDFAMTLLLLMLVRYGGGRLSLDHRWFGDKQ